MSHRYSSPRWMTTHTHNMTLEVLLRIPYECVYLTVLMPRSNCPFSPPILGPAGTLPYHSTKTVGYTYFCHNPLINPLATVTCLFDYQPVRNAVPSLILCFLTMGLFHVNSIFSCKPHCCSLCASLSEVSSSFLQRAGGFVYLILLTGTCTVM